MGLSHIASIFFRRNQRWLVGCVLAVVLALLRFPWGEADGGNSRMWSFAYFGTDEGYYTSGGRLAYLTGQFVDPELGDPPTFLTSFGMHLLSYLGYRLSGLSLASARWPTMVAAIGGWLAAYALASRKTAPIVTGAVVLVMSCNPLSLTYERVASTVVIVGSLAVLALACATSRRRALAWVAGALMALALSVKINAVVLFPVIVLAIVTVPKARWEKAIRVLGSFFFVLVLVWIGRQLCLGASSSGADGTVLVRQLSRGSQFSATLSQHPSEWSRSLLIFPRWPNNMLFGPLLVWMFAFPVWIILLCWGQTGKILTRRTVVAWGVLIYLAALGVQRYNFMRYFLPVLYFLPILIVQARSLVIQMPKPVGRKLLALAGVTVVLLAGFWLRPKQPVAELWDFLYNDVTLPRKLSWGLVAMQFVIGPLLAALALGFNLGSARCRLRWGLAIGLGVSFGWLFFVNAVIFTLNVPAELVMKQVLSQLSLIVCLGMILAGKSTRNWRHWYAGHAALYLVVAMLNADWSKAYGELAWREHYTQNASGQLAEFLPKDAIVIGTRATTLLRDTNLRLGMSSLNYTQREFVETVAGVLQNNPKRPLYWLVDGPGNSQWLSYLKEGKHRWKATEVAAVQIRSADMLTLEALPDEDLPLVPIHVLRIEPNPGHIEEGLRNTAD